MHNNSNRKIGIVGIPPLAVIRQLHAEKCLILDLDTPLVRADIESTAPYLPTVYCAILRTVMLNAMQLDIDAIYIDIGPGKCDCARHVARIIADQIRIPVITVENNDQEAFGTPLCRAEMDLTEKFLRITERVVSPAPLENPPRSCQPACGFWGVPPRDFSILSLFPPSTHVYGWTRCMENKTPADHQLEAHYNPEIPTVFFAQSFCAKTALARHLAAQHPRALYLDCDVTSGGSAKAKIQAFLELSGVSR